MEKNVKSRVRCKSRNLYEKQIKAIQNLNDNILIKDVNKPAKKNKKTFSLFE